LQDNLLPVSCRGQDWQGGLGLTLVDSLDMLLLLNKRGDVQAALEQLRQVLSFDKDVKVGAGGEGWMQLAAGANIVVVQHVEIKRRPPTTATAAVLQLTGVGVRGGPGTEE
jgi:hypothetical protein